jgi:murein DD-endopeptidase MepM/ murein hydrolase activator NlpD
MIDRILLLFIVAVSKLITPSAPDVNTPPTTQNKFEEPLFRNPLGIPIQLAANFGEIRRDHFHMGLDIRTNARENLPIYAAADGYISKISVSEGGFGNAIYITHYNGYVTVYAHLNKFYDALQKRLKQMQYERQTWEIELSFEGNEFPVKSGQFIAYSGNTGASGGPHLHFEIRDTKSGANRNPLEFLDVPDNISPTVYGVYYYDRNYSTYDASPKQIAVRRSGNNYEGALIRTGSDKIIFGLRSEDKSSNSPFMFGIYKAELFVDDQLKNSFQLDDFDYVKSRAVNASVDFSTWVKSDKTIQFLHKLPGNPLNIYEPANGEVDLRDGNEHDIKMNVSDIHGNKSTIHFRIQYDAALNDPMMFTADRFILIPNQPNTYKGESVLIDFQKESIYDKVPLRVQEEIAGGASAAVAIGEQDIPIHAPYTVKLKANANGLQYKNNVVMQMKGYRLNTVRKGKWEGDWMSVSFNKFGRAQLIVDLHEPTIQGLNVSNGTKVSNNGSIRIKVADDLGLESVRGELDGKFLLFKKSGTTYTYTVDEHAPLGSHQLKIMALDIAGNRSEKIFQIERVERVAVAKKKATKKKRKR